MTNYDKLTDEQRKKYMYTAFGVDASTNGIMDCDILSCSKCKLHLVGRSECNMKRRWWLDEEAIEYQIPVDTKVDTRVEISIDGKEWERRYFSGQFDKEGRALVWMGGRDSWTAKSDEDVLAFEYCRLV